MQIKSLVSSIELPLEDSRKLLEVQYVYKRGTSKESQFKFKDSGKECPGNIFRLLEWTPRICRVAMSINDSRRDDFPPIDGKTSSPYVERTFADDEIYQNACRECRDYCEAFPRMVHISADGEESSPIPVLSCECTDKERRIRIFASEYCCFQVASCAGGKAHLWWNNAMAEDNRKHLSLADKSYYVYVYYLMRGDKKVLIYVGKTEQKPEERWKQHILTDENDSPCVYDVVKDSEFVNCTQRELMKMATHVQVYEFQNRNEEDIAERLLICLCRPYANIDGNQNAAKANFDISAAKRCFDTMIRGSVINQFCCKIVSETVGMSVLYPDTDTLFAA